MKNILYDGYLGPRLPRQVQLERVRRVIREVLTPNQREILTDYYFHHRTVTEIARNRGVHKSTVSRTLHRAQHNLRQHLKY